MAITARPTLARRLTAVAEALGLALYCSSALLLALRLPAANADTLHHRDHHGR